MWSFSGCLGIRYSFFLFFLLINLVINLAVIYKIIGDAIAVVSIIIDIMFGRAFSMFVISFSFLSVFFL